MTPYNIGILIFLFSFITRIHSLLVVVDETQPEGDLIFKTSVYELGSECEYKINPIQTPRFVHSLISVEPKTGLVYLRQRLKCHGVQYPPYFPLFIVCNSKRLSDIKHYNLLLRILVRGKTCSRLTWNNEVERSRRNVPSAPDLYRRLNRRDIEDRQNSFNVYSNGGIELVHLPDPEQIEVFSVVPNTINQTTPENSPYYYQTFENNFDKYDFYPSEVKKRSIPSNSDVPNIKNSLSPNMASKLSIIDPINAGKLRKSEKHASTLYYSYLPAENQENPRVRNEKLFYQPIQRKRRSLLNTNAIGLNQQTTTESPKHHFHKFVKQNNRQDDLFAPENANKLHALEMQTFNNFYRVENALLKPPKFNLVPEMPEHIPDLSKIMQDERQVQNLANLDHYWDQFEEFRPIEVKKRSLADNEVRFGGEASLETKYGAKMNKLLRKKVENNILNEINKAEPLNLDLNQYRNEPHVIGGNIPVVPDFKRFNNYVKPDFGRNPRKKSRISDGYRLRRSFFDIDRMYAENDDFDRMSSDNDDFGRKLSDYDEDYPRYSDHNDNYRTYSNKQNFNDIANQVIEDFYRESPLKREKDRVSALKEEQHIPDIQDEPRPVIRFDRGAYISYTY